MRVTIDEEQGHALEEALLSLLSQDPHLAYRNFPAMRDRGDSAMALHRKRWLAAAAAGDVLLARDEAGTALAALRSHRRDFESQHFGMAVAGMEPALAIADEARRLPALRAVYAHAMTFLRSRGIDHVVAQASTQDRSACWALQEAGCFHVGTKISWMQTLTGTRHPSTLPAGLHIELHEREAIAAIDPGCWQRLDEYCAHAFDRGPFVFDLAVDSARAAALYHVWSRKALSGEWSDALIVVRKGEEIVGFNAMLLLPDMSDAAGVGVLGRGIGASLPQYRGLFTAMQYECAAVRPLGAGFLENEAQAATVGSINVFGRLGHHCLRSIASFHRSLQAR